ncbi:MAG: tryptophan synthase alpha chain [Thermosediminibacterales bacterium]|nr:tryptophan synthase alpha chain [Thermosediminibacterales bacterium]
MKSRITKKFEGLREKGEKALIIFITAGDPSIELTRDLVIEIEKAGADIIELGIPFSDPLADGPVIQAASQRAIKAGMTTEKAFNLVKALREKTEIPIAFLTYFNTVYNYGQLEFLKKCCDFGVDGMIVPDLPLEERKELEDIAKGYPVDIIPLVAPTSAQRIKKIVSGASGFVYCVSSTGVTGIRESFKTDLEAFMEEVGKHTSLPRAIGFGISGPDAVRQLKPFAEGLIVGSAVVKKIAEDGSPEKVIKRVSDFVCSLKQALAGCP